MQLREEEKFLVEGMEYSHEIGLYINEQFVCTGPIEKLMLVAREQGEPGDKLSFRAVDDETASKEHRAGKGPTWDQPVSRTIRRAIDRARQMLKKQPSSLGQEGSTQAAAVDPREAQALAFVDWLQREEGLKMKRMPVEAVGKELGTWPHDFGYTLDFEMYKDDSGKFWPQEIAACRASV